MEFARKKPANSTIPSSLFLTEISSAMMEKFSSIPDKALSALIKIS
jgi:hypothetical protein